MKYIHTGEGQRDRERQIYREEDIKKKRDWQIGGKEGERQRDKEKKTAREIY